MSFFFFFNDTATTEIYTVYNTLSLHDALPIWRGGRFGSHNMHENYPGPCSFRSENLIVATFFNGGLRAYDISNPYQPREAAYFVPGAPKLAPSGAIQINDVWVDERGIVYAVDRFAGGLYILEM